MGWRGNTSVHFCEAIDLSQETKSVEKGKVREQSSSIKEGKSVSVLECEMRIQQYCKS